MGLIRHIHEEQKEVCCWPCSPALPIVGLEGFVSVAFVCMGLRRRRLDAVIKRKKELA